MRKRPEHAWNEDASSAHWQHSVNPERSADVVVTGAIDADAVPDLERRLLAAVPAGPAPRLVVDLAGVTSLSAAGLDVLLAVQQRLESLGGRLELLDTPAAVVLLLHDAVLDADRVPVEPPRAGDC